MQYAVAALALLAAVTPALAQQPPCTLSLGLPVQVQSGSTIELVPQNASGLTTYTIFASTDPQLWNAEVRHINQLLAIVPNFKFTTPRVAQETTYHFYAVGANEQRACEAHGLVKLLPDAAVTAVSGRVVVPVAGSTAGAFGARFRTSLRLTGFGTGKVYFRRQGNFHGDDRDPHLTYNLGLAPVDGPLATKYWDDVIAEMGASGIGSLDVVPDGNFAPAVEARAYNDTPVGRFGDLLPVLEPADLYSQSLTVPLAAETLQFSRINVGMRTFAEPVTVDVSIVSRAGGLIPVRTLELAANSFHQLTLDELAGSQAAPGEEVFLFFGNRPVAAYYSVTENSTNDLNVVVEKTRPRQKDVKSLVLGN